MKHFFVQVAFPFVGAVMDGEAGDRRIEDAEIGKRLIEIVFYDGDILSFRKSAVEALDHRGGEVESYGVGIRDGLKHQTQKAPITRTEVQHTTSSRWDQLEECSFAFDTVRNTIRTPEVLNCVFSFYPFVDCCQVPFLLN